MCGAGKNYCLIYLVRVGWQNGRFWELVVILQIISRLSLEMKIEWVTFRDFQCTQSRFSFYKNGIAVGYTVPKNLMKGEWNGLFEKEKKE